MQKKAVLSNRIYLSVDEKLKKKLDKELTYLIPSYNPTDPPQVIKNMATIRPSLVTIPIGRSDLIPEGYEIVDKRISAPVDFPAFLPELYTDQLEVFNAVSDNCILNAKPGWGKTFTGLAIASKLGQKSLIICHTAALVDQWKEEVEKVFNITPSLIAGTKEELDGPIVIGGTKKLYNRIPLVQKEFGAVFLDEMHHVSSPTFGKLLDTNYSRYKIGLSGTIERKDGKHVVFRDYFGSHVLKPKPSNYMQPEVHLIPTGIQFPSSGAWPQRLNGLVYNEEYQHLVALLAATYEAKGHKVLILSSRVDFIKACAELAGENTAYITGEVSKEDRKRIKTEVLEGKVTKLFATQSIFSEGISINPLSCVILAEPNNNMPLLEQIIGRVQRKCEGKPTPVVVDLQLLGSTAKRQASNRLGFYMKQGYPIKNF